MFSPHDQYGEYRYAKKSMGYDKEEGRSQCTLPTAGLPMCEEATAYARCLQPFRSLWNYRMVIAFIATPLQQVVRCPASGNHTTATLRLSPRLCIVFSVRSAGSSKGPAAEGRIMPSLELIEEY